LILHVPFNSSVGPNIPLNIFLSKTNSFSLMDSFKTPVSQPHVTTGLMIVRYIFKFGLLADKFTLEYGSVCIICFVTRHDSFSYFFFNTVISVYDWSSVFIWTILFQSHVAGIQIIHLAISPCTIASPCIFIKTYRSINDSSSYFLSPVKLYNCALRQIDISRAIQIACPAEEKWNDATVV
jgi:hypothetical protein